MVWTSSTATTSIDYSVAKTARAAQREKKIGVFTGSIARSAKLLHISYSKGNFEVLRPTGATFCTDGDEIWYGTVDLFGPVLRVKFNPHRCNNWYRPQKLNILLKFYQISEYQRPPRAYLLRDFHEICKICTLFQHASAVKIRILS